MFWLPTQLAILVHPPIDWPPIKSFSVSRIKLSLPSPSLSIKPLSLISSPIAWHCETLFPYLIFQSSTSPLIASFSNQTSFPILSVVQRHVPSNISGTITMYPLLAIYIGTAVCSAAAAMMPWTWTIGINFFFPV